MTISRNTKWHKKPLRKPLVLLAGSTTTISLSTDGQGTSKNQHELYTEGRNSCIPDHKHDSFDNTLYSIHMVAYPEIHVVPYHNVESGSHNCCTGLLFWNLRVLGQNFGVNKVCQESQTVIHLS